MKIFFMVAGLPPRKDGASSMWRKGSELARLKALRAAAAGVMGAAAITRGRISLTIRVFADPAKGDLDNFITGICDGLMAAQVQAPIEPALWQDVPEAIRPHRAICFHDDAFVHRIVAERMTAADGDEHYEVELEW